MSPIGDTWVDADRDKAGMSRRRKLSAPFPYFGGKRRVADIVWRALGPVKRYIEPFFGSGAVLLARPAEHLLSRNVIEIVNDIDGLLVNFWRAAQHDPDAVARHAEWPAFEADMHARHLWLLGQRERITERLIVDPNWYDAQAAGWWVWGMGLWIGADWCSGRGAWTVEDGKLVKRAGANNVFLRIPYLTSAGCGVHSLAWRGVIFERMRELSERLCYVRVICGDWKRALGPGSISLSTTPASDVGIFLDPPYVSRERWRRVYAHDDDVALDAARWAAEHPELRIVYAGYVGTAVDDILSSWRTFRWVSGGGMAKISKRQDTRAKRNRGRETLWFSPACDDIAAADAKPPGLWDEGAG